MNRLPTIVLAIALVVALAAMPLGAAGALADGDEQTDETESVAPGEQLSGAVGVQEAEIQGELTERTYGIELANAQSDDERADVVEKQFADAEDRFAAHEQRLEELEDARDSGEITEGQYRAEVATIAAETATVERLAGDANATAGELNGSVLEDRGIDVSAIEELQNNAAELSGGDVAAIAQSIAGDSVGQSPVADREPGAPIDTPGTDQSNDAAADRDGDTESADDDAESTDETESDSDDAETTNETEHEETDRHSGGE